jgi:hypothetical protein
MTNELLEIGETYITYIVLDYNSRDEIPKVLKELQQISTKKTSVKR